MSPSCISTSRLPSLSALPFHNSLCFSKPDRINRQFAGTLLKEKSNSIQLCFWSSCQDDILAFSRSLFLFLDFFPFSLQIPFSRLSLFFDLMKCAEVHETLSLFSEEGQPSPPLPPYKGGLYRGL